MTRPNAIPGAPRRWGFWRHALVFFFVFGPAWFWFVGLDLFKPLAVYIGLVFVVRLVRRGARR